MSIQKLSYYPLVTLSFIQCYLYQLFIRDHFAVEVGRTFRNAKIQF